MMPPRFRMLPPSAAPLGPLDIMSGLRGWRVGGETLETLRQKLRARFDVRHVFFSTSGRAGLSVGLQALRALNPERDEVLLPAFTSFSVPSAVVNAGLKISLYDLHADTLAPDLSSLEKALNSRTLCVVACHLFGYPLDLQSLREMCRACGTHLLDDAAQAMGARINGKLAGTMGDVGLFSLSRGKNMTAVDGGIVLTDRDDVASSLRGMILPKGSDGAAQAMKNLARSLALTFMLHPRAYWLPASLPFLHIGTSIFDPEFETDGLDGFRAGLAGRVLERLDALNAGRRGVSISLLAGLESVSGVRTVRPLPAAEPVFLRLPVLPVSGGWAGGNIFEVPELGVVRSYPLALHQISGVLPHLAGAGRYPVSEMLARNLLTLPTHAFVQETDVNAICDVFRNLSGNPSVLQKEAA